jgi:hypothetical protein
LRRLGLGMFYFFFLLTYIIFIMDLSTVRVYNNAMAFHNGGGDIMARTTQYVVWA